MAWTAPSDHAATVVSVVEWNNFHGTSGNCAYLKAIADAPMKAQKDGGAILGGRAKLNFIQGANIFVTVDDAAGDDRINVTLAASGGTIPTAWETSGILQTCTTDSSQGSFGAYDEAIASTAAAAIWAVLTISESGHARGRVRIGLGAGGSEVEELTLAYALGYSNAVCTFSIPISIPISTRVAVCAANDIDADADSVYYSITLGE